MPLTIVALRKMAFELRLLLCAQLLHRLFDAVPKRRAETRSFIEGIGTLAGELSAVRYSPSGNGT